MLVLFCIFINITVHLWRYFQKRKKLSAYHMLNYIREEKTGVLKSIIITYLVCFFWAAVLSRTPSEFIQYRIMPFWSWREAAINIVTRADYGMLLQIVANGLALIPVGILLNVLYDMPLKKAWVCGLLISLFIELSQLVFHLGLFEWDDMLHNSIGCMLGAWIGKQFRKIKLEKK